MQVANVGFSGLMILLIPLITVIFWMALFVKIVAPWTTLYNIRQISSKERFQWVGKTFTRNLIN